MFFLLDLINSIEAQSGHLKSWKVQIWFDAVANNICATQLNIHFNTGHGCSKTKTEFITLNHIILTFNLKVARTTVTWNIFTSRFWLLCFNICIVSIGVTSIKLFLSSCKQWEAKVTQYERDFERVSATVRKEVVRFEVPMFTFFLFPWCHRTAENVCHYWLTHN